MEQIHITIKFLNAAYKDNIAFGTKLNTAR